MARGERRRPPARKTKERPRRRTGPATAETAPGGSGSVRAAWLLFAVILAVYAGHALLFGRVINDDAFISFRYSWNLAHGNGLVYNPGETVEGFSNPLQVLLFTLVLPLTGWTFEGTLTAARALGLLWGLLAITGLYGLSREMLCHWSLWGRTRRRLALLPPALAAGSAPLAAAAMTGLETTLFAALLTLGLWALAVEQRSGRFRGAAALFALASLTRPEGALLAGAAAAGSLAASRWRVNGERRRSRRLALIALAATAAAVALWSLFRFIHFDGELLPNTWFAKQGGFPGQTWSGYLAAYFGRYGLFFMPLAAGLAALVRAGRRAAPLWPAAALVLAHLASFTITGADWMPGFRLLAPTVPALALIEAFGGLALLSLLHDRFDRSAVRTWAAYVAAGLLLAAQLQAWTPSAGLRHHLSTREAGYRDGHLALARWLGGEAQLPGSSTVALMDIGLVGYLNPQLRVLDISGLTDRTIAKSPGGFLDKAYDPACVLDQEPAVVVITMAGPRGLPRPLDPSRLTPGTPADRRLFEHPRFRDNYRPARLFDHRHPEITYALAAYRCTAPSH